MFSRLLLVLLLLATARVSAAMLDIVVEEPNAEGKACGLSKEALTSRGRLALRAGGVQVSNLANGYRLGVSLVSQRKVYPYIPAEAIANPYESGYRSGYQSGYERVRREIDRYQNP